MTRNIMIRAYHFHESLIHAQAIICKQMISFLFSVFFRFCSEKLQLALAARERAEKEAAGVRGSAKADAGGHGAFAARSA